MAVAFPWAKTASLLTFHSHAVAVVICVFFYYSFFFTWARAVGKEIKPLHDKHILTVHKGEYGLHLGLLYKEKASLSELSVFFAVVLMLMESRKLNKFLHSKLLLHYNVVRPLENRVVWFTGPL